MASITVIGETVADAVTPFDRGSDSLTLTVMPGGSPANTAVALSRLGTQTRFAGRLSRGVLGGLLREHLEKSHVDLSACVSADGEATLAIAAVDAQGRAAYDFYVKDTVDWQWTPAELARGHDHHTAAIHTGSLALAIPPGAEVITEFLRTAAVTSTISIDPNARPGILGADAYRNRFDEWVELADIIKVSEEDLAYIFPDADLAELRLRWHRAGVRLVVVTMGANGATASLDGEPCHTPSLPVTAIDTIGAGDAFTAGLLHHLAEAGHLGGRLGPDLDLDAVGRAMSFASIVAARTCEVPGADPPWAADLGTPPR